MLIATTIQLSRTFQQEICWKYFSCRLNWLLGLLYSTNLLLFIVIYYWFAMSSTTYEVVIFNCRN